MIFNSLKTLCKIITQIVHPNFPSFLVFLSVQVKPHQSPKMSAIDVPPERPSKEPQTVTEEIVDEIVEGQVDTTDTKMRYLAYANRFRTIALASSRYLAYTSGSS
jgi:hypothetical protein